MKPQLIMMSILTFLAVGLVGALGVYSLFQAQWFTAIICLVISLGGAFFFIRKDIKNGNI